MKIINLRDYYPFYTHDTLLEFSDEVAQAMAEAERLERNYNTLIIKLLFPLSKPHEKDIFGISAEGFELSKKKICLFCTISDKT